MTYFSQFWQTGDVITASGLNGVITTITTSSTISGGQGLILCNANANAFTITLPTSAGICKIFEMKKIDSTANIITISPNTSGTIDSSSTIGLYAWNDAYSIVYAGLNNAGGANYYII